MKGFILPIALILAVGSSEARKKTGGYVRSEGPDSLPVTRSLQDEETSKYGVNPDGSKCKFAKEKKTSAPTMSAAPSTSPEPSAAPSVTAMPSVGKKGPGKKTKAPTVSPAPSMSLEPTFLPTKTASPTETASPTTSKQGKKKSPKTKYPICEESVKDGLSNQEKISNTSPAEALAQPGPAAGLGVAVLAVAAIGAFVAFKVIRGRSKRRAQKSSLVVVPQVSR